MYIAIAPMMNCTDKHERYFLRLLSPHVWLYTEMVVAQALLYCNPKRWLEYHPEEHPLALQLGGHDPVVLTQGARMGEEFGYDEINLNVGCPSPRVSSGRFGACLMREGRFVADIVHAMQSAVCIPISVKCRIGVDQFDSYDFLSRFIADVSAAGCQTFHIHARKAWLDGLSPKENRLIPPINYGVVYQIKKDFPGLKIILNGNIKSVSEMKQHMQYVDGVMIGRSAYDNPYFLTEIEREFFGAQKIANRHEIIALMIPYIVEQLKKKVKLSRITRHILGLFRGQPGAQRWRRYLSEHAYQVNAGVEVIQEALLHLI